MGREEKPTGESGAPSNPEGKRIDRRNPNEKFFWRVPHQFAVFRMSFKIADEYRHRTFYCIITVDDFKGSEDIYRGVLPIAENGDYCDLRLTGPKKFIRAQDSVYFVVAIHDLEDPGLPASMPSGHDCGVNCVYQCCGTYPASSRDSVCDGLLVWVWSSNYNTERAFDRVRSVDLMTDEGSRNWEGELTVYHSYGSLKLDYAAFRDAVVAKVKVELKAGRHICGVIIEAVVMKNDGDSFCCDEDILLLEKKASDENINNAEERLEQLLPLQLSRSSITLPSTPSDLFVKAILSDRFDNPIVEDRAKFCALRSGTSEEWICGGEILVTVVWT